MPRLPSSTSLIVGWRAARSWPALAVVVLIGGCAQIVGLEDWQNAKASSSSSGTASTSSNGGAGGQGGMGGVGGDGAIPTCIDGRTNGLESDVDCGGDACKTCPQGEHCNWDNDCATNVCNAQHICGPPSTVKVCPPAPDPLAPTCADCAVNGSETDVDCGGDSCAPCPAGDHCNWDSDCVTSACSPLGVCGPPIAPACPTPDPLNPTCSDCVQNGGETDIDCGGDACPPCLDGAACTINSDCKGDLCDLGKCADGLPRCEPLDPQNPRCDDCTKNGLETDIDCGGDSCPPCASTKTCTGPADCASLSCVNNACL